MQQEAQITPGAHPATALVSSSDVNGTDVYSPSGDHLGQIDHLMIDKVSGRIAYAVMRFGGFLGFGEGAHPIPWKKLRYDVTREGYVTDITKEQLEGAPQSPDDWRVSRDYDRRAYDYYGIPPYWL
ncbi:PRC-barrel domain-containing protein [Xinfangfangia pollutisoli]|uniref:PRC-barrel domain-containing protein n=1 Tax=Xinfangfangia pollutisoli TaxID=2865960 RepID=UPI001CD64B12|nr:PRC-barrel domain-containing protein [Xinfangfangia pollutisoli]